MPAAIEIAGEPIDYDDIHLIMEYKTNDQWGPYTAPRANRYILHNDNKNPQISSLEFFEKSLNNFDARLLVISGLQMMDSYPYARGVREERLAKVKEQIARQSANTMVHFEMASFVEHKLIERLIDNVISFSDSIGMNEQELENLEHIIEKGHVTFASESNPRVAQTLHQMRNVFRSLNTRYYKNTVKDVRRRMLTRIHVHTLAYQAILIVKNSQWKNAKNAAAKAALTAHRHVCGTDMINPEASNLILDDSFSTSTNQTDDVPIKRIQLNIKDPVPCWTENLGIWHSEIVEVEICVAPVLVCKVARQTAGAGDNISAAGLILQI